jgi:hypothetical protein
VEGFTSGEGLKDAAPRVVHSSEVLVDVGGIKVPLSLQLGCPLPQGPEGGIFLHMNLRAFDEYFERDGDCDAGSLSERQQDFLHVSCLLRCGLDIERRENALLAYEGLRARSPYGSYMREYSVFWWFDSVAQGVGHVLTLEVKRYDANNGAESEAFTIDDVGNAQWNLGLEHGTDLVEIAVDLSNEFADRPYEPGFFEGKVGLVRRGGGKGFAHKACAVRDAGGIGCIIYEQTGDRDSMGGVQFMGRNFEGHEYPDPGIPSVLVEADVGNRLLAAISSPDDARVRINIDRSPESLRRTAPDFEGFRSAARAGEPIHLAVLVERLRRSHDPSSQAFLAWFEGSNFPTTRHSPLLARYGSQNPFNTLPSPPAPAPLPLQL